MRSSRPQCRLAVSADSGSVNSPRDFGLADPRPRHAFFSPWKGRRNKAHSGAKRNCGFGRYQQDGLDKPPKGAAEDSRDGVASGLPSLPSGATLLLRTIYPQFRFASLWALFHRPLRGLIAVSSCDVTQFLSPGDVSRAASNLPQPTSLDLPHDLPFARDRFEVAVEVHKERSIGVRLKA